LRTKAVKTDGGYLLNGQKTWCSNAYLAEYVLVVARTSSGGSKHEGISMFSIPVGTAGMEIRPELVAGSGADPPTSRRQDPCRMTGKMMCDGRAAS
jgi:alkylation response protein AidB-like acyl-CoA dehydrogenase